MKRTAAASLALLTATAFALLSAVALAQPLAPIPEATLKAIETAKNEHENYRKICQFFDDYLAEQSQEYRDAVKWICLKQAQSIDKLERISFIYHNPINPGGAVDISYKDPAPPRYGGGSSGSIRLRNNKVFALHFVADFTHDCGCCTFDIAPGYLTDGFMDYIARITTLEYLDLGGGAITDAGLAKLAGMHSLKELVFGGGGQYTESYGDSITRVAPSNHHITGSAFQHLHKLTQLEVLDLATDESSGNQGWTGIKKESDILFEALSHYPKLKKLHVRNVELTPKTMQRLSQCRGLEELTISGTMPEPCLELLKPLAKLKELNIRLSDANRSFEFAGLPALDTLYISASRDKEALADAMFTVTLTDFPEIKSLMTLAHGHNSQFVISDTPKLTHNSLAFTGDAESTIICSEHIVVDAAQPQISTGETSELSLSAWDGWSHGTRLPDGAALPEGKKFVTRLTCLKNDAPEVLFNLLRSSPEAKSLRLTLSEKFSIPPEVFEAIRQMDELEEVSLRLAGIDMTPEVFAAIRQINKLQELSLSRCTLAEPLDLLQLKALRRLTLSSMELPAEFGHFPELEELTLWGCRTPRNFSLVNLPAVTKIAISEHKGARSLLIKDAPRFEHFHTWATIWDTLVFEGCPSLKDGYFIQTGTFNPHKHVDLRGTQVGRKHPSVQYMIDVGVEVLLD